MTQILRHPGNTLVVSAASIWEMSVKHHLGKWPEVALSLFLRLALPLSLIPPGEAHARPAAFQIWPSHLKRTARIMGA
ncbi:type II toxin-antitoxin system VapC family toxin [Deinococcus sp. SDU3-2]|uniref:Type II toxin-antitoxin system VapC family toxin n=1 Tax=Deinococcus terrestris TaxID=2651870 RepID=A0A7X1NTM8_9DEIO|nr:hypothetical protein [Deinococcus terrestris]MPY65418.1 type II toxin-antitoxin system VapC family toxin [Deinococcus terrestris]